MQLNEMSSRPCGWYDNSGDNSGIIISSRIRLTRNIHNSAFISNCTLGQKNELLKRLSDVVEEQTYGKLEFLRIDTMTDMEIRFLVERNLITSEMGSGRGPRGVFLAHDELTFIMINDQDHLRLQCLMPGFNLMACWKRINRLDDSIESKIDYAFDTTLGYLTASPADVGTGMRVSVMLHLVALRLTDQLNRLKSSAKAMKFNVHGLWGEGTEVLGDMYQISNQITLGVSEQECIASFTNDIIPQIVKYEMIAREELLRHPAYLDDTVFRALGVLNSARMITASEAMDYLCKLRLGILLKRLDEVSLERVDALFLFVQSAHMQMSIGKELASQECDYLRANLIRDMLKSG